MDKRPKENGGAGEALQPELRLYLSSGERFFGPGSCQLLRLIGQTGALRAACEQMGISYSKGWKRVASMEARLGYALVQRHRGGASRGESHLTERGRALVESYEAVLRECRAQMERSFARHFPGQLPEGEPEEPPEQAPE